jgi:hypothetical protein
MSIQVHPEYNPGDVQGSAWTHERLSAERIAALIEDITPPEDIRAGRQMGVHIIDGNDPHADIGRFVEATVFDEFFNNNLQVMAAEYAPYDQSSTFLALVDYEAKQAVGAVRLIKPSAAGLKSLKDLVSPQLGNEANPWYQEGDTETSRLMEMGANYDSTVDIGTMGVMPEYRSRHTRDGASAVLYSTCVRWSHQTGHNYWISVVDENIYTMMQAWGEPFKEFEHAPMAAYLDSLKSQPVHLEFYSALERVRAFDQGVFDMYTKGAGLDTQFVLPQFEDNVQ